MTDQPKSRLGRGLDALFAEEEAYESTPSLSTPQDPSVTEEDASNENEGVTLMPIEFIRPGTFQPRSHFDEQSLEELASSIKQYGILQPLLVRPVAGEPDQFEIIAGERRWRAAQKAQLHDVPVIIQNFDDATALEIGLIENLQREDLNSIEEAMGYARLMDQFGYTQETLSDKVGKSRSYVANTLRLLKLPSEIQALVKNGEISAGHARQLIGAQDPMALAQRIIEQNLSVREIEQMIGGKGKTPSAQREGTKKAGKKPVEVVRLENEISNILGLKVSIDGAGQTGTVTLHYKTLDQMDMILQKLSQ